MLTKGRLLALAGVTVLGAVLGMVVAGAGASPAGDDDRPTGPEVMGIRVPLAPGPPPTDEAFGRASAAKLVPGYAPTAKEVSATYVLFSNDAYFAESPEGLRDYRLQNVPAWLVTYTGLDLPLHGAPGMVNHELNVVVDVRTGEAIWEFSYR